MWLAPADLAVGVHQQPADSRHAVRPTPPHGELVARVPNDDTPKADEFRLAATGRVSTGVRERFPPAGR